MTNWKTVSKKFVKSLDQKCRSLTIKNQEKNNLHVKKIPIIRNFQKYVIIRSNYLKSDKSK